MSAITIRQMAERVEALLEARLGARGETFYEKLRHRGRALPLRVRRAAEGLAGASEACRDPRLLRLLNETAVAEDYDICLAYLGERQRFLRAVLWRDARRRVLWGGAAALALCSGYALWLR